MNESQASENAEEVASLIVATSVLSHYTRIDLKNDIFAALLSSHKEGFSAGVEASAEVAMKEKCDICDCGIIHT